MTTVYRRILVWLLSEEGQDLMEYGLLAFFIAAGVVAVLTLVAPPLMSLYSRILSKLPF